LRRARAHPEKYPWVTQLLACKPAKVVAVAIANKTARIAWAVLTKKEIYRTHPTIRGNVRFLLHRGRRPYMAHSAIRYGTTDLVLAVEPE
jgi:hypothetical protein